MLGFICFLGILFFIIVSYLMGAIPFGLILAKIKNKDLTSLGSKSIGATNVVRNTNATLGILTLILDFLKGYFAIVFSACIFRLLFLYNPQFFMHLFPLVYLSCFFVVLGHCFSVFIKFKGGKGVSTSGGVLLAVSPILFLIATLALVITFLIYKIVSLASVITAGIVGLVCYIPWFNYYYLGLVSGFNSIKIEQLSMFPVAYGYFYVLGISIIIMFMCILVICKHHGNIDRLLLKKERLFQIGKDEVTQEHIIKNKNEK